MECCEEHATLEKVNTDSDSSGEKYENTAEDYYSKHGIAYKLARLYFRVGNWQGTQIERHRILYSFHKTMNFWIYVCFFWKGHVNWFLIRDDLLFDFRFAASHDLDVKAQKKFGQKKERKTNSSYLMSDFVDLKTQKKGISDE